MIRLDQIDQHWINIGACGYYMLSITFYYYICYMLLLKTVPEVLPGSALLALALEVSSQVLQTDSVQLQDSVFHALTPLGQTSMSNLNQIQAVK